MKYRFVVAIEASIDDDLVLHALRHELGDLDAARAALAAGGSG